MSSKKVQAISGVSAGIENVLMTVYPSIAKTASGRALGSLYNSIPLKINGVKLSNLLFVLPTSPVALLLYLSLKVIGQRYVLTNRSVQKWASLGARMLSDVPLSQIEHVEVDQHPGQVFYRAADLLLCGSGNSPLMILEGVPQAEVLRETILKARDAHRQVEGALATIEARQSA